MYKLIHVCDNCGFFFRKAKLLLYSKCQQVWEFLVECQYNNEPYTLEKVSKLAHLPWDLVLSI